MKTINIKYQKGSILPALLSMLLLVFIITAGLSETVLTEYKVISAKQDQSKSLLQATASLESAEKLLLEQESRPIAAESINQMAGLESPLEEGYVLQTALNEYQLLQTKDPLTNEELHWYAQPTQWWQTYGNESDSLAHDDTSATSYYIVEEYAEDFSGQDLSQAKYYYAKPSKIIYQVTARAKGGNSDSQAATRLQTLVAQTYY